jgi:hypothetical protein
MIAPPVVRIRPCGRAALASAGRALVGLRGSSEDRVRIVAPYWFGAPGKPFRRRSGIPFHTAGREPSPPASPLTTSRAPSGHDRRADAVPRDGHHPPDFRPLQRMRDRRFGHRGPATPATFRPQRFSRSRRLAPRDPARVCLTPVTLLGFRLQGLDPLRWVAPLSRPVPAGESVPRATEIGRGRCPPGVRPSKALPASAADPDRPTTTRPRGRGDETVGESSSRALPPAAAGCPDETGRRFGVLPGGGLGVSSSRRRRPFWGSSPRLPAIARERGREECR